MATAIKTWPLEAKTAVAEVLVSLQIPIRTSDAPTTPSNNQQEKTFGSVAESTARGERPRARDLLTQLSGMFAELEKQTESANATFTPR